MGGGIKYFVFSDFCNKYLCWYTLLYQILISLKCHIKTMFLNTKKSSGSCLSASFFKQTVVDATPHVAKETFQCITLARAPTRCWHVGTTWLAVSTNTLPVNTLYVRFSNLITYCCVVLLDLLLISETMSLYSIVWCTLIQTFFFSF